MWTDVRATLDVSVPLFSQVASIATSKHLPVRADHIWTLRYLGGARKFHCSLTVETAGLEHDSTALDLL